MSEHPLIDDGESGTTPATSVHSGDDNEPRDNEKRSWAPASKKAVGLTVGLAAISGFLFGYDTGVVSAALFYVSASQNFGMSSFEEETFVSACIGAAICGAVLTSALDGVFGRKTIVLVSAGLFAIGAVIMATCPTNAFWLLVVGRAIVGVGIGASSTIVPVYISEMAPAELRGQLTVTNNAFCTGGQLAAALIAYGLTFTDPTVCWRIMLGAGAIPAIAQIVGFVFMPESPRWLLLKHRKGLALAALRALKQPQAALTTVAAELDYMADALAEEKVQSATPAGAIRSICRSRRLIQYLFVGCFLQFTQQIAGINTIMYYGKPSMREFIYALLASSLVIGLFLCSGSEIVKAALLNATSNDPAAHNNTHTTATGARQSTDLSNGHVVVLVTAGFGFVNFVFTLLGIYLAGRCSRRSLTLSSLLLVVLALGVWCFCFLIILPLRHKLAFISQLRLLGGTGVAFFAGKTYIALAGCGFYLAVFAYGMGPMPWTINSELFVDIHDLRDVMEFYVGLAARFCALYLGPRYPLSVRGFSTGIATMTNWTSNLLISQFFLSVINAYVRLFPEEDSAIAGDKGRLFAGVPRFLQTIFVAQQSLVRLGVACALWTLAIVSAGCLLVVHIMLPETGGTTLEDVSRLSNSQEKRGDKQICSTSGQLDDVTKPR